MYLIFTKKCQLSIKFIAFLMLWCYCCLLNSSKIAPNKVHNVHHCRKFMQIRCQKRAGTKIKKNFVRFLSIIVNAPALLMLKPSKTSEGNKTANIPQSAT